MSLDPGAGRSFLPEAVAGWVHSGRAVTVRSSSGMGADVPAWTESATPCCPHAGSARCRRTPPGHSPQPEPGTRSRTPGRRRRRTRSLSLPRTPPAWMGSSPGYRLRAGPLMAVRRNGPNGRWQGGCPCTGGKQPRRPCTRPSVPLFPVCPGGRKTAGEAADEARWHHSSLSSSSSGSRATSWPRHQDCDSERHLRSGDPRPAAQALFGSGIVAGPRGAGLSPKAGPPSRSSHRRCNHGSPSRSRAPADLASSVSPQPVDLAGRQVDVMFVQERDQLRGAEESARGHELL